MHFVKHEHTECPGPINQWFPIKPIHHVGNAGCLAVAIADKTGCPSLYHFRLSLFGMGPTLCTSILILGGHRGYSSVT